jgi:hypothetical protein
MTNHGFRALCCAAFALCGTAPALAVDFSLFGDVSIEKGGDEESPATFRMGKFDLFVNQEIDDDTRVNAEVIFEDTGHGFETDIERFAVTYVVDEDLNLGAGRFHTPVGFWNHNFHHGIIVQDTVTRPFFLEPDDSHEGVIPTHVVGLLANGTSARGSYTVGYHLGVANGPSIDTSLNQEDDEDPELEVNNYQDRTSDKSLVARLGVTPEEGNWGIGVSVMNNKITESGEPVADPAEAPYLAEGEVLFEQRIVGLDVRYTTDKYYAIVEYFRISVTDNADFNTQRVASNPDEYEGVAQYVQVGYSASEAVGVALRLEELKFDEGATYFETLGFEPQKRTVVALRYNLSNSNVLRFQMTKGKTDDESFTQYTAQWFFMLF